MTLSGDQNEKWIQPSVTGTEADEVTLSVPSGSPPLVVPSIDRLIVPAGSIRVYKSTPLSRPDLPAVNV